MALSALLYAGSHTVPGAAAETHPATADPPSRAVYLLAEVEAARSRQLYLVLEASVPRLLVRAEGVTLLELALERAEWRTVAGSAGPGDGVAWPALAFRLAGAPPEIRRPVLTPPGETAAPAGSPAEPKTDPPGASLDFRARQRRDLLDRAPASYLLPFAPSGEGPVLEVAVEGDGRAAPGTGGVRERWTRLTARLGGERPPDRLRLVLPADSARRLALVLQPETRLLVAPPVSTDGTPQR